eukprot:11009784-Alexandrium_andersonii.AAC.1
MPPLHGDGVMSEISMATHTTRGGTRTGGMHKRWVVVRPPAPADPGAPEIAGDADIGHGSVDQQLPDTPQYLALELCACLCSSCVAVLPP